MGGILTTLNKLYSVNNKILLKAAFVKPSLCWRHHVILEMLMESTFALVDIIFVSRVSVNAVATVGLTQSVITLVYAVAIGLSMAATAVVARRTGEKDHEGAAKAATQTIILGSIVAILIAVGIIFPKEILGLGGGESDLIEEGYGYTRVLLGGNLTVVLLFLINAVFRGACDASVAMDLGAIKWTGTLFWSNFIFVKGPVPAYGVEGAAIATTIGRETAYHCTVYDPLLG